MLYLLLWRRAELTGPAGRLRSRHGEGSHELVVAFALVGLDVLNKLIRKGKYSLHSVPELTVTEKLQQGTHLKEGEGKKNDE